MRPALVKFELASFSHSKLNNLIYPHFLVIRYLTNKIKYCTQVKNNLKRYVFKR